VASGPDLTQTKALQRAGADEARSGRLTREERRWIDANPERAARGLNQVDQAVRSFRGGKAA
jgi:hypothetical protein